MKVSIEVFLNIERNYTRSRGPFNINSREYKDNPNLTVAIVAYEYIQNIIS